MRCRWAPLRGLACALCSTLPAWVSLPAHSQEALPPSEWEGAIGLVARHSPAFPGSSDVSLKASPGGFIRWGRYTLTGAGGFTTRRRDEVERGLGAEVARRGTLRFNLNLRVDPGRQERNSADLFGLGDIPWTVRGRLTARWDPGGGWRASAAWGVDVLNRSGGAQWDASLNRDWSLGHGQVLSLGAGAGLADRRYMQAWHGITTEQAARSGYQPFRADGGLRSLSVDATYRHEFGPDRSGFVSANQSTLLASAARSPLTRQAAVFVVQGGLAWRF